MILKAKHHFIIYPMFKWLTMFLLKKRFSQVQIMGDYEVTKRPVLVIANHISWWDGFWIMYLNLKMLHRRFHFMMLAEQLKKHWYFQFSGAYSVKKGSRSVIESLNYTNELLKDPGNMVFMFPQGEIKSIYNDHIKFERGIQRVIRKSSDDVQVVFVANLVDYFSNPKPGLFMYIQTYSAKKIKLNDLEMEYGLFYQKSLKTQKSKCS